MYFKLALRNLKKSIKDYTIYFLTLVFGVCIFYTFNSIGSQKIMMDINEYQSNLFDVVDKIMGVTSIFIAFILGFLIIYANNYLIKRRKKEFGIYMTLGMENGKLSRVLFIETLIIGIFSLAIGALLGITLSQILSVFTAKLFQVELIEFKFIFSKAALLKTVFYFAVIYTFVLIFNSITIKKVKLIDLLYSAKKNENLKVRKTWVSVIIFIISITMIGTSYYILIKNGIAIVSLDIAKPIILGAIGTFLFFFSLSGFLLKIIQNNKSFYLKDLNMFVLRQINSKINTTFISMTFISLMLFIAICTLSTGLGISKGLNKDIKELTQFDGSIWNLNGDKIVEVLEADKLSNMIDYAEYTNYDSKVPYSSFLTKKGIENGNKYYPIFTDANLNVIGLFEYNNLLRLLDKESVSLKENEYLTFGDIDDIEESINEAIKENRKINIGGKELNPNGSKLMNFVSYDSTMKNNICTIVVNDNLIKGLKPINTFVNFNYKSNEDGNEKVLRELIKDKNKENSNENYIYYINRQDIENTSTGLGAMISYLAIYIGIIFLITSAAVLALQQLCESADNSYRYELLKKVGVDDNIINKSLLTQIGIYFMMPLSLALVHTIAGLQFSKDIVAMVGSDSMMIYILITLGILVLVYGGYFMATYTGSKKIIK